MNRYLTAAALVVGLAATPAAAQNLQGQWLHTEPMPTGGNFSVTVAFAPGRALQYEMAVPGNPQNNGFGAGITRCEGTYQVSGGNLATRWANCNQCGSMGCVGFATNAIPFGGPVQFLNQDSMTISGGRFSRQ